jgi:putative phage-type endonuclease
MEQRTEAWHALRKTRIGGSDASAALSISEYKTPFQLWEEKLGLRTNDFISPAMQRGIDLEPEALQWFENETGYLMSPSIVLHPTIEFMMASLDGLEIEGKIALEIKAPGPQVHAIAMAGEIPEKNIPQLQHQMACLGLRSIYFLSYDPSSQALLTLERDDEYIKQMIQKEAEFWDCVVRKVPPPLTDRDYEYCETAEWKELTDEWKSLCDLEDKKERIRKRILEISGKRNTKGNGVSITRVLRKGGFDYDAMPIPKEIDKEQYRKPSIETFRIMVS